MEAPDGGLVSRRRFIGCGIAGLSALMLPASIIKQQHISYMKYYDVIIIGGSYAGMAAAMALGRALRRVLVIDAGLPCNAATPHSHNFLTNDGKTPAEIAASARRQVGQYRSVELVNGTADTVAATGKTFAVHTADGRLFNARKLIFASGIKDQLPDVPGFAECWGKTALHCPYCHGYEVAGQNTGILGHGEAVYDYTRLLANWTKHLCIYTNGPAQLSAEQLSRLQMHNIRVDETPILALQHSKGQLQSILLSDGRVQPLSVLYSRLPFVQSSPLPATLGCQLSEEGYLKTDSLQKTSVHGIYAAGDNSSRLRTVANAVASGTTAGMMVNKELVEEDF